MGQSLKKFSSGHDEKKIREIDRIIDKCYTEHFKNVKVPKELTLAKEPTLADFYRAVSKTVEEINKFFGNTQFRVPDVENLKKSFDHHAHKEESGEGVTKEEFQKILQDILITDTRFTGVGATDTLIYIFGVPLTAFLFKRGLFPNVVPDQFFIPGITSATVFALAKLNKI